MNNLPFPEARSYFNPSGNNVSFLYGVVSHDSKFKLIKRRNLKDDSVAEIALLNDFL